MTEFGRKNLRGKEALPRPEDTPLNRLVAFVFEKIQNREIGRDEIMLHVEESLASLVDLGARESLIEQVRLIMQQRLTVTSDERALEIWSVEVLWSQDGGIPDIYIYSSAPGMKVPSFRMRQTSIDHAVSHLYHWAAGQDFSEAVAGADQVKVMWNRGGCKNKLAASAIFAGYVAHKHESPIRVLKHIKHATY